MMASYGTGKGWIASLHRTTVRPARPRRRVTDTRRTRRLFSLAAVGLSGFVGEHATHAQGRDYIYCMRTGGEEYSTYDTYYSTAVFEGDYGDTLGHENDFYDFLKANRPDLFYVHSYCFHEGTRGDAEADLRRSQQAAEREGYRVVSTNWTPDGGESDAGPLPDQPIRDFSVRIGGSQPYTEQGAFGASWTVDPNVLLICVRDHECEDGDKVTVSVNGNEVVTAEIVQDWHCEDVTLGPGAHAIELRAVNGTGFKGHDCSHADVNTGEIMIASDREDSVQRWRHRGGAGSSATLNVVLE